MSVDCLIEFVATRFKVKSMQSCEALDECYQLWIEPWDHTVEDLPKPVGIGISSVSNADVEFTQENYGLNFTIVGESHDELVSSCVASEIDALGIDEVFDPFKKDLLEIIKAVFDEHENPPPGIGLVKAVDTVRILTLWTHDHGIEPCGDGSAEGWSEVGLLGRVTLRGMHEHLCKLQGGQKCST